MRSRSALRARRWFAVGGLALLVAGVVLAGTVPAARYNRRHGLHFEAGAPSSTTSTSSTTTIPPTTTTPTTAASSPPSTASSRPAVRPARPAPTVSSPGAAPAAGAARATWYESGSGTANGERFDPDGLTFANRTMAFGTRVRFCHGGRCVVARCNDRGPFVGGVSFDLSRGTFASIASLGSGVITVSWEVV